MQLQYERAEEALVLRKWKPLISGSVTGELEINGRKIQNFVTLPIIHVRMMGLHRERVVAFTETGRAYTLREEQNMDGAEAFIRRMSRDSSHARVDFLPTRPDPLSTLLSTDDVFGEYDFGNEGSSQFEFAVKGKNGELPSLDNADETLKLVPIGRRHDQWY